MYGDRDNQSCLIALPMKCFVYCLGFLIVVLASSNAFSSFEYRIRMIAPKLYPYLLPENAGSPVFECMVTDCSCYKVVPDDAAAFLKGAVPGSRVLSGKGFGVSDFSEFCSSASDRILDQGAVALKLTGYHAQRMVRDYRPDLLRFLCVERSPLKHILFDGSSVDLESVGDVVYSAFAELKFANLESISMAIGNLFKSSFRERVSSEESAGSCGAGSGGRRDLGDLEPDSPRSDASSVSCASRKSKQRMSEEIKTNNVFCADGGSAFLTFKLSPVVHGMRWIEGLQVTFVFPQTLKGNAFFEEKDPSRLFSGLIAVAGGGCKTTCGISFLKNFVPDRCSLLFAHFASNIEIICCLEGAEERPFLHQSISDLHVTLQQKILGFLEHVVPTKLQDSVDFWGSFRAA